MAKKAKKQAVLFIVASAADLAITLWCTTLTGYGTKFTEANAIANGILVAGGPLALSAFKIGGVILVLVLLGILARDSRDVVRWGARCVFLLGALRAGVGAWSWLLALASTY